MQIGFAVPVAGAWSTPANQVLIAQRAEELGYHSLWTLQRVVNPAGSADHTYRNVTEVRSLFPPDALQPLAPLGAAIEGLVSGDIGRALGDGADAAAQSGAALLHEAGRKTGEKVKGFLDGLEESKKP